MSESTVPTPPVVKKSAKQSRARRLQILREALLAVALLAAGGLVVAGVAGWSHELALIVAGLILGGLSWLFLTEVS